jgi:hypothetical protein
MSMAVDELEEETRFETGLTALAVYLVYSGCDIDEIEWRDELCFFLFENTPQLQGEMTKFVSGQARVEPQQYSNTFGQVTKRMWRERDATEGGRSWKSRR